MYILVVNAGSSSLKYQLFDMDQRSVLAKGLCERIGTDGLFTHSKLIGDKASVKQLPVDLPDHAAAAAIVIKYLTDADYGVIKDMSEIGAIGHRIVSGGPWLTKSCLIDGADGEVMATLRKCVNFAPLHTKGHIQCIEGITKILPDVPQVLVMDTSFHQTMPKKAYTYPIDRKIAEKYSIRRYGAHGTSHRYVSEKAIEYLGKPDAKIVTCHLGNGSSITAVDGGKCIDTSMGLTPLEGVIMGSRCGSIDPAVVPFVMEYAGIKPEKVSDWMNNECGFYGLTGHKDLRDIRAAAQNGDENARNALDILAYQVKKYIGSYAAAMNGLDCIVFTAGIGENDEDLRREVTANMSFLGVEIDDEKNNTVRQHKDQAVIDITGVNSRVKVLVIPTDEELAIATDTAQIVNGR